MPAVTRFAPSPTGYLHLGHAYSALIAANVAEALGGRFLLRIEDIDVVRCRPEFEDAIREDLAWLGLELEQPVRRQSEHLADYLKALETLEAQGLIYPCFCTRGDIRAEIARADAAPHGPEGAIYPGTCRTLSPVVRAERIGAGAPHALRLDMAPAVLAAGALTWHEQERGDITAEPALFGDVILARKDTPTSYHLAVTLDDHLQGVTLVTRGEDLFEATHIHRLLQALLGLEIPKYSHHALLRDASGRRLAKRDRALTLHELRTAGHTPERVREILADPVKVLAFMGDL